jgi:hypothetical protein
MMFLLVALVSVPTVTMLPKQLLLVETMNKGVGRTQVDESMRAAQGPTTPTQEGSPTQQEWCTTTTTAQATPTTRNA